MNLFAPTRRLALLPQRIRGMFNLNDPRWGRDDEPNSGDSGATPPPPPPPSYQPPPPPPAQPRPGTQGNNRPQGPNLDEMGRDLMNKIGGMFGGGGNGNDNGKGAPGRGGPSIQPGSIAVIVGGIAIAAWVASGIYVVNEGEQVVITQFGQYHKTVGAGLGLRLPYPIQNATKLRVTQIRSIDVGRDDIVKATGLRNAAMLTQDENIVEIKFAVQYRLSDARAYLFESRDPDEAVRQVSESAVREVVGQMNLDEALATERDQIAPRIRDQMQGMLDRYKVGIDVYAVTLQEVRAPEQLKAAFDDVLKAEQERERVKNQALAYAANVVPRAEGAAARLNEEAQGYKERVVAQAMGDTERFASILPQYQKAPQAIRDRMYTDAMAQMYSNVSKVVVENKEGGNLLYLPLDKLMSATSEAAAPAAGAAPAAAGNAQASASSPAATPPATVAVDPRARGNERSRTREVDSR